MESDPPSRSKYLPLLMALGAVAVATAATGEGTDAPEPRALGARAVALLCFAIVTLLLGALFSMVRTALGAHEPEEEDEQPPNGFFSRTHPDVLARDRLFDRSCSACAIGFSIIGAFFAIDFISRLLHVSPIVGCFLAGLLIVAFQFLVVDVVLLNFSLRHPYWVLRMFGWVALLVSTPFRPFARALVSAAPFRPQPEATARYRYVRTREMRLLPHVRGVDRLVEEEAVEMIDSVREFTESTARDVMTPRTEIEGVPRNISYDELIRTLQETPYSRIVVYEENLDHIVGVLLAKEILLNRPQEPFDLMRTPIVVPLDMRLPELLTRLRSARSYLAVVMDEYGGTAGIVTLHDLFEQVIGTHIEDEEEEEELWIDMIDAEHARLSGRVEVWEVNEELDLDLDESVARTLGGYLMYRFGRLPAPGDEWPVNKGRFRVAAVESNRIEIIDFERDSAARENLEPVQEPVP